MERKNSIIIKGIDGRDILYRNFNGAVSRFNNTGAKKFTVRLNEEVAIDLKEKGFNIKQKEFDNGEVTYLLEVFINYGSYAPNIYAITGNVKKLLDDNTIKSLQGADIISVDLCIRPYSWELNGKTGIKAYVKYMYVTIEEDPFADDYAYMDGEDFNYGEEE